MSTTHKRKAKIGGSQRPRPSKKADVKPSPTPAHPETPVQHAPQPASTLDSSTRSKAVIEAFAHVLRDLDDQNLSGIKAVKAALLRVMKHLQVISAETGWLQLAESTAYLSYLLCYSVDTDTSASVDSICKKWEAVLTKLADDMDLAKGVNPVEFVNLSDSKNMLGDIALELMGVLCMYTGGTKPKIDKAFQEVISSISVETGSASTASVSAFVKGNTIESVQGTFFADNWAYGNSSIRNHFEDNEIGSVGGSMFSGTKAGVVHSTPTPPKDVSLGSGVPPPAYPNPKTQDSD